MKTSFTVLILLLASTSFSQNYKMALGFKGGYPGYGSLNAKKSISKSDYLEASIGGFGRNSYSTGFHVELDYERMQALEEGFSFYYGGGVLLGLTSSIFHLAPKALLGLEYNFDRAVVANSLYAHRVIQLAIQKGLDDVIEELFFRAYFTILLILLGWFYVLFVYIKSS